MEDRLCLTVEEMGKKLSISRAGAYELARRADFPAIHAGRRILIPISGLEKWLEAQAGGYDDGRTA